MLSQNVFILLYQDILTISNCDPRKYITNDKINAFVEFKMFPNISIEDLHWVFVTHILQINKNILVCYQPKTPQVFWYSFHDKMVDAQYVSVCGSESYL